MIAFNFREIFLNSFSEGKEVELMGIAGKPGKVILSNGMKNILKKEQWGIISQLCSLDVQTTKSSISPDLQKVLDNHSKFEEVEYHIEHQQQVLQLLNDNLTLAQNRMK